MKYAIEYQNAAAVEYRAAFVARAKFAYVRSIYDSHVCMSDYRYHSKRAAQFTKLAMMYREQGF